ncbi:MAG: hypothetical protein N4A47_04575 [Clostridia bacterium]|jgi:hypothetical protein|nr:hypothetical protein [Clostridia bacterium]
MATYKNIQKYVKDKYGNSIKTCWIADMKEYHGLKKRIAPNRISMDTKTNPCPKDKMDMITEAFKHFNMI